tara:strand:- start:903 stop:1676 length:774 start_codon:yes stop_codon:yes gene_type:complete
MKAVILAGGLGTRFSEETVFKPKPMIEIGGKPILWHIMKIYSHYGINDFIICLGYKGYVVKEYFYNYFMHQSDMSIDVQKNKITFHKKEIEPWRIELVDTGENSMTGGRLGRLSELLKNEKYFSFTYGDGVGNIKLDSLIKSHLDSGKEATLTATYSPGRFGAITINEGLVTSFKEKPKNDEGFINGGFFILSPKIFERINGDDTVWEEEPLESLAKDGELNVFEHRDFWQPMDTQRDKIFLQKLWDDKKAPWKIWD